MESLTSAPARRPTGVRIVTVFGDEILSVLSLNGIVKLTLSERTYRVELTSFALVMRHTLPRARR